MATQTTNLGLTKPSDSDAPDISVINNNMDLIDEEFESMVDTEDYDQTASTEAEISPVILAKINAVSEQVTSNYNLLNTNKAESTDVYTKSEVNNLLSELQKKDPTLLHTDVDTISVGISFEGGTTDPFEITVVSFDHTDIYADKFVCSYMGGNSFRFIKCCGNSSINIESIVQYSASAIVVTFDSKLPSGTYVEFRIL